jgi:glutamine amidotransferase
MANTISILDYGLGNPESVKNMLKKVGLQAKIIDNTEDLAQASSIIMPGVGGIMAGLWNCCKATDGRRR